MENRILVGHSRDIEPQRFGVIEVRSIINELVSDRDVTVSTIDLDGKNRKTRNKLSHSFYYVLEGEGFFTIGGEKHLVKEGDYVLIPPNTPYFDEGKMKLLSVCSPRFDRNNVEYLD